MSGILDVLSPDFFDSKAAHPPLRGRPAPRHRYRAARGPRDRTRALGAALAVNIGNIGRAVPILAILALSQPFLGFGFDTALVALTALAIPPILINASTG